jgi:hypothetical protein
VAGRCLLHRGGPVRPSTLADLYLLASVLHDWDDTWPASWPPWATAPRPRIFEMLLPEDATPHRAKMSDVLMMLLFDGARERTIGQYRALLEGTGSQLERVVASTDTRRPTRGGGPDRGATRWPTGLG